MSTALDTDLMSALARPFEAREVKFKPAVVSGNRALALAYVDARTVMDRLDDVVGSLGWKDEYQFLDDGSVLCKLSLRIGDDWVTKMDVGGQSEQSDEGDRRKAAVSDALKRTAVKFGVGRYLYRLPSQWVDYDPQRKQFKATPRLPASTVPHGSAASVRGQESATQGREVPSKEMSWLLEQLPRVGRTRDDIKLFLDELNKANPDCGPVPFDLEDMTRRQFLKVRDRLNVLLKQLGQQ